MTLVLEFFSAGFYRLREALQEALKAHFPESRFYWFAEEHVQKQESFDCRPPEPPARPLLKGLLYRRPAPHQRYISSGYCSIPAGRAT